MDQPTNPGRKPSHRVYQVTGEGEKAIWTTIGAAWPTRNKGFTISLDALPLQGRVVMLPIKEAPQQDGAQQ